MRTESRCWPSRSGVRALTVGAAGPSGIGPGAGPAKVRLSQSQGMYGCTLHTSTGHVKGGLNAAK